MNRLLLVFVVLTVPQFFADCAPGGGGPGTRKCVSACGRNAFCDTSKEYADCVCDDGYYGSPYSGCTETPECRADADCTDQHICLSNLCTTPCFTQCPQDVGCVVANHKATCIYGGQTLGHFGPRP